MPSNINLAYGGKKYLSPAKRPKLEDVGARPTGTPKPIFHRNPNIPTAEQLMNPPVDEGDGTERDHTAYLTAEDLPDDWLALMLAEAKKGRGPTSFMKVLGLTRAGLETLLATSPEFAEAYERCLIVCSEWWEDQGRFLVTGANKGNAQVWIANMVNRWGWNSEKRDISGDPNIKISVNNQNRDLTDAELDAELARRGINVNLFRETLQENE